MTILLLAEVKFFCYIHYSKFYSMKSHKTIIYSKFWHLVLIGTFLCVFVDGTYCQIRVYKEAKVYITAKSTGQLLADCGLKYFETLEQPEEHFPTIMIDPDKTFQTIEGFGGAFTDAASVTFG
jgi:hypothetical protein